MQCKVNEIATDFGCLPNDPIKFVQRFYGIGLALIAGVALLFLMWGGFTILTSRGDPYRLNIGKTYIFYSIAGLLLAAFGFVFIQLVVVDILHVPGFQ